MLGRHKGVKIACAIFLLALHLFCRATGFGQIAIGAGSTTSNPPIRTKSLPCKELGGSHDTLVVLRTGATELEGRLTIHLDTSIRCFPNHLIFSDLEETYLGEHILDALHDVDVNISDHHPDFGLYRRLKKEGRSALATTDLAGLPDAIASKSGNTQIPGWKLDKWKFLPMLKRTLQERPGMKWYVFIEADTFLFWSTLQQYLTSLNHSNPIYAGNSMFIGETRFAHGGSGFVVSQPALRMVVEYYEAHKNEIEDFTADHWCGDCVLGKTFTDAGVPFTSAWPAFQGDFPGIFPYIQANDQSVRGESTPRWCSPTISYHHMTSSMIQSLWQFEQDWMAGKTVVRNKLYRRTVDCQTSHGYHGRSTDRSQATETLRHQDVFTALIMPQMMRPRDGWENLSDKEEGIFTSAHECRLRCIAQRECRQYSFDYLRVCRTRVNPRLGRAQSGVMSGWIEDRVVELHRGMESCVNEGWLF